MQEQEFPVSQNSNLIDKVEKEKEIIALINSKGTFTSQMTSENKSLLVANAELIAYIDCTTNELHKNKTKIEWLVTVEDSKKNFIYNIEKYHIYRLKVKKADSDNFLLIDNLKYLLEVIKKSKELEVIISDKLKNELEHWLRDIQIKIKTEEDEKIYQEIKEILKEQL